jgi:Fe-S-cluster containining protein
MKKLPWYQDGLKFECTACGSCCSGEPGYVWVDNAEIAAMAEAMNMSDDEFRDQFIRRIGSNFSLKEYADGDCILLDPQTRHCLAYSARPIQCRTWPFWTTNLKTPADWQATCEHCPGAGQGELYTLEQIEIERKKKERL